jgi:hypothetical protein
MKKALLCILTVTLVASCASNKAGVINTFGYMQPSYPGIVTEEDRHKGPDTLYIAYIETKKEINPIWTTGYANDKTYNLLVSKVTPPVTIGVLKETGDSAIVTAGFSNVLYQVTFEEKRNNTNASKNSGHRNMLLIQNNNVSPESFIEIKTIKELLPALHM